MRNEEEKQQVRIIPDNYSSGIVVFGKSYSALVLIECIVVMLSLGGLFWIILKGLFAKQPGLVIGIVCSVAAIAGKLALDGIYDEDLIHFLMNVILFKSNRRIVTFEKQICADDERIDSIGGVIVRVYNALMKKINRKTEKTNGVSEDEERKITGTLTDCRN